MTTGKFQLNPTDSALSDSSISSKQPTYSHPAKSPIATLLLLTISHLKTRILLSKMPSSQHLHLLPRRSQLKKNELIN
jgi:hypothetical protein